MRRALQRVMANVRTAMGITDESLEAGDDEFAGMVWGEGMNLGMPVRWCLRHHGASFSEEAVGPELSYVSGHTSGSAEVWETDFSGYTQTLQLDDHEAALLAGWARSGWWAHPGACADLHVGLGLGGLRKGLVPGPAEVGDERHPLSFSFYGEASDDDGAADDEVEVTLRVRGGGVIVARMYVSRATWLPARMVLRVCGDEEEWVFDDWQSTRRGDDTVGSGKTLNPEP